MKFAGAFLLLLSTLGVWAAGQSSMQDMTGITQVEKRPEGKVAIYHGGGIATVASTSLPAEFLASWQLAAVEIIPAQRNGVLTEYSIPNLGDVVEPARIKELFSGMERGKYESVEEYSARLAGTSGKEVTVLVPLKRSVHFDASSGVVTLRSGGFTVENNRLLLGLDMEKKLSHTTEYVTGLGIKVDGATEAYETVVLSCPLGPQRVVNRDDPSERYSLDARYAKLVPHLRIWGAFSSALPRYKTDILDHENGLTWSFRKSLNPDIDPEHLYLLVSAKVLPRPPTEETLSFKMPKIESPMSRIFGGLIFEAQITRVAITDTSTRKFYFLLDFEEQK